MSANSSRTEMREVRTYFANEIEATLGMLRSPQHAHIKHEVETRLRDLRRAVVGFSPQYVDMSASEIVCALREGCE